MEVNSMPKGNAPFSLRIPQELLERLKAVARKNKRSTNRELDQMIEEYLARYEEDEKPH